MSSSTDLSPTIVVGALATSDYADQAPDYATFQATPEFLGLIGKVVVACAQHNFTEVRAVGFPEWGPVDSPDLRSPQDPELIAKRYGSFFFVDHPKFGGHEIMSRAVDLADLRVRLEDAASLDAVVFMSPEARSSYEFHDDEVIGGRHLSSKHASLSAYRRPAGRPHLRPVSLRRHPRHC